MRRSLLIALLLLALGLVGWLVLRTPSRSVRGPAAEVIDVAIERSPELSTPTSSSGEGRAPSPTASVEVPTASVEQDPRVEIRGRILLPEGAPAVGVPLKVSSFGGAPLQALHADAPPDSVLTEGVSDSEGRFTLRVVRPPHVWLVLEIRPPRHCTASRNLGAPEPGARVGVGDVVLTPGGTVRGRVVDLRGTPLPGWNVYSKASRFSESGPVSRYSDLGRTTSTGEFLLTGLPAGTQRISIESELTGSVSGPEVIVELDRETYVDVPFDPSEWTSRILVVPRLEPRDQVFLDEQVRFVLTSSSPSELRLEKEVRLRSSCSFDDLRPGEYAIELVDPRFAAWRVTGVKPGTRLTAPIRGNASVELDVRDEQSGFAIAEYSVQVRYDTARHLYKTFELAAHGSHGEFAGIWPVDQTWIVRARGHAPREVPLAGLAPNEHRAVVVRLSPGVTVAGLVHNQETQRPVPGATVRIAPADQAAPGDKMPPALRFDAAVLATTETDEAGRFTFECVEARLQRLEANIAGTRSPIVEVDASRSEASRDVLIEMPSLGRLHGRVLAPAGASLEGLAIRLVAVTPRAEPLAGLELSSSGPSDTPVDTSGSFTTGWVATGEQRVILVGPRTWVRTRPRSADAAASTPLELGTVQVEPDVVTQREFDVRGRFTLGVDVRVSVDGGTAVGAVVGLVGVENATLRSQATTDAFGLAHFVLVPPGAYRVAVRDGESAWTWADARTLTAEAGAATRHDVSVHLVEGEITLRSGDPPAPIASTEVFLSLPDAPFADPGRVVTDEAGRVRVRWPIGTCVVRRDGRRKTTNLVGSVAWTASGPVPAVLDLNAE